MNEPEVAVESSPVVVSVALLARHPVEFLSVFPLVDVGLWHALKDGLAPCLGLDGSVDGVKGLAVGADSEGVRSRREAGTESGEQVGLGEVSGGVGGGGSGGGAGTPGLVEHAVEGDVEVLVGVIGHHFVEEAIVDAGVVYGGLEGALEGELEIFLGIGGEG